jgi:hypothetical protein
MNSPPSPVIGACILTYNSEEVVLGCIQALKSALKDVLHEIVIVDNHSSDRSAAVVGRHDSELKLIRSPVNTGYARGNNLGARYLLECGCQYLVFINPDVTVRHDTLARMKDVLAENRDAGCVGGIAIIQGDASKKCFRSKPTFAQKLWIYSKARDFPGLRTWLAAMTKSLEARHFMATLPSAQPVYAVSGACIMFPAEVFAKIGGFDEHTFLFQEEFIISERLQAAGYRVYGAPGVTYEHQHGHSVRARVLHAQWCFIKSEQYLVHKYYGWSLPKRALLGTIRCADLAAEAVLVGLNRLYKRFRSPRERSER